MKARCLLLASLVTLAGCNSTNSHAPAPSNEPLVRDSYSCPVPAETGGALSLNNTSGKYLTVYVADKEGYAYQVIERVGSPSVRQWNAKLKDGTYHLVCVFRNTSSIAGAEFEVTGSPYKEASKMLPITEDDVAKASVAHAAQQHGELAQWAGLDDALLLATQSGDREAAKKAWLAAYRKYRTFDDSNTEWEGPVDDIGDFGTSATPTPEDIEGYHRVEWGLWHGEAMPEVAQHAQFLNDNVHTVVEGVGQFALASADYGLRTHEMTEELERFDLQGYRDYGSNSLPLAVQTDMEATRTMIDPLRDILAQRGANLAEIDKSLDKVEDFSQTMDPHDPTDRQVLNGFVADANEKLAVIATMTVIRRMWMSCPLHFSRRAFLGGVAALAATPSASAAIAASAGDDPESSTEQASALPLEGEHQRGIVDPPQRYSVHCALDFLPEVSLAEYFRALTQRTRILVAGGPAAPDGIAFPATDSGELGLDIPTDYLTITVGVGAALFDDRFGLSKLKPAHLVQMEPFADDSLVDSSCHGDIILQICADEKDTALHALRDILRHTREFATTRWLQNGYQNEPRPTGTQRNHLGFKDGIVNPHQDDFDSLVWAGNDEPAWAAGGSYMAVRLIGMLTEFWDRISIAEQGQIFGRDRYTGGPLTGGDEWAAPDYTDDAVGDVIPTDAHIRLANPLTPDTADQLMLRRSYNYDNGLRRNGNIDAGLVFVAFQQDLKRQFITVQKRLEGEPLADYLLPFGGGYFFMLPGLKDEYDYFGRLLLTQQ